jgi:hypothetical protein
MPSRCTIAFQVGLLLLMAGMAGAQVPATSGRSGFSRATINATAPRSPVAAPRAAPRNVHVADERGNAADALGATGALSPSPAQLPAGAPPASALPANSLPPAGGPAGTLPTGTTRMAGPLAPIAVAQGEPTLGRITKGTGTLPNDGGQVWREYDLTPYTSKISGVDKPQQAVIDWVLRETGTEVWFSSPLGILNADKNTLRVYHTPAIQETVKGIYDRFMSTSAEATRLNVRVITVNNPSWRSRALTLLKPIEVQSRGVDAWLVSRENAVRLMADLRQRVDFKEHAAPIVDVPNGQTYPLALTKQRQYVRSIRPKPEAFPGYEPDVVTIDEGYSMSLSPLNAVDGKSLDVVVKCSIDQVEKLIDIPLDIPTALGQPQRVAIQVPQLVSWRLHERFRWPNDHVLLLSCGVVATPNADTSSRPFLSSLMANNRADALLLIEPVAGTAPVATATSALPPALALPGASPVLIPPPGTAAGPFTASPLLPPSRQSAPWRR